jgi:tetratricopeptide (TPR) repeat protein
MEDKSIVKGQSESNAPLRNGSIERNDYIDMLVLEICVNGDSLDKYERILKKMAGDQYETCVCFIDLFKQIDDKQLFGVDELERLDTMGKGLHLSDKTLEAIRKKLSIHEIKNRIPVSPEKKKSYHKGIFASILVLAAILLFILLPKKSNNQNVSISASKDTVFIEKNETLEVVRVIEVEKPLQESIQIQNSGNLGDIIVESPEPSMIAQDNHSAAKTDEIVSKTKPDASHSTSTRDNQTEKKGGSVDVIGRYLSSAENGDAPAQFNLGQSYLQGIGVEKDMKEAEKWLERSASQGFVSAQQVLADHYYYDEKDYSKAIPLYLLAAEGGSKDAMWTLGMFYKDVKKNPAEAVGWLKKAANRENAAAQFELAELYRVGSPGVNKSFQEARKYYRAAARNNYDGAEDALKALESENIVFAKGRVFIREKGNLDPLPGASILIESPSGELSTYEGPDGGYSHHISGKGGEFSLEVPKGSKLKFSFIGYIDLSVYPNENMHVVMEEISF